jgi:predicted phage baseplate assembly protein
VDPLFLDSSSSPAQVTHLVWDAAEKLQHNHDLSRTVLAGNLVPATQGQRFTESFAIETPPAGNPNLPLAAVRMGPNSTADSFSSINLYTLGQTPLAWLAADAVSRPLPEIQVVETPPSDPPFAWTWYRSLLDAGELDTAFTLDRARYIPLARNSDGSISYEYDGDSGDTIRFGDNVFGSIPETGAVFKVTYRVGSGAEGNLAADSITRFDPATATMLTAVTNPFAATGGADQELNETVRRLAPQAFRAVQFRAVRPEDYVAAAQTLDWVERAGTTFRWTGSWLTVFTTADPLGSEQITTGEQLVLIRLLNRRRLAGYESYAPAPHYLSLDLEVYVCAGPDFFRGDVKASVLSALSAKRNPDGSFGFFYPDNFTFGQALERSALEAAIQQAYGVAGVHSILYRCRGVMVNYVEMPDQVTVGPSDILRVDNDLSVPERGSVRIYVDGGK